jgi:ubiquinone/menaquinone biosynthesis C-methylase UbiE
MSEITGDQQVQSEVLEGLAMAVNHRRWFVELAVPYLGTHPIEVGSGLGDYAMDWAPHFTRLTATEADPDRLVLLKDRLSGHANIDVKQLLLPTDEDGGYTGAVSYNVLEHIVDHVGALRSVARLVKPGSAIVLIVPAFPFAMSPVDVATGHVRRYTKKSMINTLTEAGLEIERVQYLNALGLIGYYMATSVFKLVPKEGPMVKFYDRLILPLTKGAESIVRAPFGQSVFAVARTPANG